MLNIHQHHFDEVFDKLSNDVQVGSRRLWFSRAIFEMFFAKDDLLTNRVSCSWTRFPFDQLGVLLTNVPFESTGCIIRNKTIF